MLPKITPIARHSAPTVLLLAIGLVLFAAALYWAANQIARDARAIFEIAGADAEDGIERRIQANTDILYGMRGLFSASEFVRRDAFRCYVCGLDPARRYPAVQDVTFGACLWRKSALTKPPCGAI